MNLGEREVEVSSGVFTTFSSVCLETVPLLVEINT